MSNLSKLISISYISKVTNIKERIAVEFVAFIKRPRMFISYLDKYSVMNYVHGYETGIGNRILSKSIEKLIIDVYKIQAWNDGW